MELDPRISASRLRVSRRRALGIGGGVVGMAGVLAVCATDTGPNPTTATTSAAAATPVADDELIALLDQAPRCVLTTEETQGPYWFDVDDIRQDIREDRPGLQLDLALCDADPAAGGIANAVVEVWHCDAGGVYSGFMSESTGGPGGPPGNLFADIAHSDGSYSAGNGESTTSDDSTFLRGAQATNADGIAVFTTIFPG